MPDWIVNYWVQWAFGIVAAALIAGYRRLVKRVKDAQKKDVALDAGVQALLRDRITQECDRFFAKGSASMHARENIRSMYDAYHDLGGYSIVTDMVNRVMQLPFN